LDPLGSGSDYTAFFDHLGIASLNFGFSGGYGVYHSTLDNLFWMESFGDPEFLYHAVAARLLGLLAMRLAGADVVPLRYVPYAETLEEQLDDLRREAIRERRMDKPFPGTEAKPIAADFGPVLDALAGFRASAEALDAALDGVPSAPPADLRPLNDAVVRVERALIDPEGLPGRKWFRHALYAPGLSTGYASWPFPGLAQAVKEHDAGMWDNQVRAVVARLAAAAAAMDRAAGLASP
ncbi:MAG: transferrin receptor-like dimerization domain-containing protein, partial [Acidobacteriota bacterium]